VSRINTIVRSLLTFSHADTYDDAPHATLQIANTVQEALRLIRLSPDTRNLKFHCLVPETAYVKGDPNLLMQVFVNLINNACDASPAGGNIQISGKLKKRHIVIDTIDDGHGIDEQHRSHIFEPFFTTKAVGKGTGLGLSLAYSIVRNHGGKLRSTQRRSKTCMQVVLPIVPAP